MTRRCEETVPLLSPLRDGALPPDDRAWVEEHLQGCAACAERARLLRAQGEALRRHVEARAAGARFDGFADGVMARLAREGRHRSPWDSVRVFGADVLRPHRAGLSAVALAACLALALVWRPLAGGVVPAPDELALADAPPAGGASIEDLEYDDGSNGAVLQLRGRNAPEGPATTVIWLSDDPSRGVAR